MRRFAFAPGFLALNLALAGTASAAADFTFNVKVDLDSVHQDVQIVQVNCQVSSSAVFDVPADTVAQGYMNVPLQNGAYHGTLAVSASHGVGKDPGLGKVYRCDLFLAKTNVFNWPQQGANVEMWKRAKDGTTLKYTISGPVQ